MSVLKDIAGSLGVLPLLAAKGGKNAGFALGILPGMIYRDQYEDDKKPAAEEAKMIGKKKGGKVSSASARGDGCCERGKTKGRMV